MENKRYGIYSNQKQLTTREYRKYIMNKRIKTYDSRGTETDMKRPGTKRPKRI